MTADDGDEQDARYAAGFVAQMRSLSSALLSWSQLDLGAPHEGFGGINEAAEELALEIGKLAAEVGERIASSRRAHRLAEAWTEFEAEVRAALRYLRGNKQ